MYRKLSGTGCWNCKKWEDPEHLREHWLQWQGRERKQAHTHTYIQSLVLHAWNSSLWLLPAQVAFDTPTRCKLQIFTWMFLFCSFWWFFVMKPTCLCEFGCFSLIHFSLLWVNWVWLSNLGFFSAYNTDETCLLTFVILWAWLVGVWKSAEETCPCFLAHRKCKEEKQCFWTLHLLL